MREFMNMLQRTPIEDLKAATPEQQSYYESWLADHPESQISQELFETCESRMAELLRSFETVHSIADLYAVTQITVENALESSMRQAAKVSMRPLAELLLVSKVKHGSASREYNEVFPRYQYFSRAVGMLNNGKVDHTR